MRHFLNSLTAVISLASLVSPVHAETYQFVQPLQGLTAEAMAESAPVGATSLTCKAFHCYALIGGTIWAVGNNSKGQLGLGNTTSLYTWTDTGVTADSVAAGNYHGYALKNGTIWSVGANDNGQLGLGDTTNRVYWTDTGLSARSVAAGANHGYALNEGAVWSVGYNNSGELGRSDVCSGVSTCYVTTWGDTGFKADAVFAGSAYGYALKNGTLWSVGYNRYGQLSLGDTTNRSSWTDTGFSLDSVIPGALHAYALKNGTIWSVGYNRYGQLGRSSESTCTGYNCSTVWADTGFAADNVAAGNHQGYALKDGKIWSVGDNSFGSLGLGDNANRSSWTDTGFIADSVFAGSSYGYAFKNGTIWSVGWNTSGQLGLGDTTDRNTWTEVVDPFSMP